MPLLTLTLSSRFNVYVVLDSLYNPHYGYFSKQVVIFTPGEPFDFTSLPDEPAFRSELGRRYTEFEDALDLKEKEQNDTRQIWHTPTELFRVSLPTTPVMQLFYRKLFPASLWTGNRAMSCLRVSFEVLSL